MGEFQGGMFFHISILFGPRNEFFSEMRLELSDEILYLYESLVVYFSFSKKVLLVYGDQFFSLYLQCCTYITLCSSGNWLDEFSKFKKVPKSK